MRGWLRAKQPALGVITSKYQGSLFAPVCDDRTKLEKEKHDVRMTGHMPILFLN